MNGNSRHDTREVEHVGRGVEAVRRRRAHHLLGDARDRYDVAIVDKVCRKVFVADDPSNARITCEMLADQLG